MSYSVPFYFLYHICLYLNNITTINIYAATRKYEEISVSNQVPDAITIPSGFEPKSDIDDQNGNTQNETCLFLVIHVSAPPYIHFNYGFIIKEKDVSDNDRLEMRINDLEKENEALKDRLKYTESKIQKMKEFHSQQMNALREALIRLERKVDHKLKYELIELDLESDWQNYGNYESKAQAIKIHNTVYLKGNVKGGSGSDNITTLPQGWRPSENLRFCQVQGNAPHSVPILVHRNGSIYTYSSWKHWVILDGLSYVLN